MQRYRGIMPNSAMKDKPANDNDPAKSGTRRRGDVLPISLPPRGVSREEAAAYIGISPSLFDELLKDGRMPAPKRINRRTVWDRRKVDEAFDALPDDGGGNPWDELNSRAE
jgi:predicted DNA-binding transcriptional regulator AlpA